MGVGRSGGQVDSSTLGRGVHRLDLGALGERKGVFNIHAKVAHRALDLRVSKQDLHGPQVNCTPF